MVMILATSVLAQQIIYDYVVNKTPDERYIVHSNGTVTDQQTQLMWKRCSEGLSGDDCGQGSVRLLNWENALKRADMANKENFAQYNNWRLPNFKEMLSLVAYDREKPAINLMVFPNVASDAFFWTSSPDINNNLHTWHVNMHRGFLGSQSRDGADLQVRLVRNNQ